MKPLSLTTEAIAELLSTTQWTHDFDQKDFIPLALKMRAYEVAANEIIFQEGDHEQYMAIICKGRVEIIKTGSRKEDSVIASLNQGQSLGEMCLIDGDSRSAKAIAKTDSILLVFEKAGLEQLKIENPEVAIKITWKLAQMLSHRLRKTSGLLTDFLSNP